MEGDASVDLTLSGAGGRRAVYINVAALQLLTLGIAAATASVAMSLTLLQHQTPPI